LLLYIVQQPFSFLKGFVFVKLWQAITTAVSTNISVGLYKQLFVYNIIVL